MTNLVKKQFLPTLLYFFIFTLIGIMVSSVGPSLPYIAEKYQVSIGQAGIIFSLRALGFLFGAFLFGKLLDKFSYYGHKIIAFSILFTIISLIYIAHAQTWILLLAGFTFWGIAESGMDIGGNTLLSWIYGNKVTPYMNALHFFFGVGSLIAPFIVILILKNNDVSNVFNIQALLLLPCLIAFMLVPTPQKNILHQTPPISEKKSGNFIIGLCVFFFLYVGTEVTLGGWLFTLAKTKIGLSANKAALLSSTFWLFFTLGRLGGILSSKTIHPLKLLKTCLFMCCVISIVASLINYSDLSVFCVSILFALFMAPIFPTTMAQINLTLPVNGVITSYLLIGSSLGAMFLPWVVGKFLETSSTNLFFTIIAVDFIITFITLIWIFKNHTATPNRGTYASQQS